MCRMLCLFAVSLLFLASCDDDTPSSSSSPPDCQTRSTADLTAVNRTVYNVEVFIDGGSAALLRPGERVTRTVTAVVSHSLLVREVNCFFCIECRWSVSLAACTAQTYECLS